MLCKPKPCFWLQKLCCNLLCPTTDLGKITIGLCLIFSSKHGWEELCKLSKGGELCPQYVAVSSVDGDRLAPSKRARAKSPAGSCSSGALWSYAEEVRAFQGKWITYSCKELVSGFCLQVFPSVTRTRGTLSRSSLTRWSPEVTSKPHHAVILWLRDGCSPTGTKGYTRLQIVCKVCTVGCPREFLTLDRELHRGDAKTRQSQCGLGGVTQRFCLCCSA